jgi:hypothetical protein
MNASMKRRAAVLLALATTLQPLALVAQQPSQPKQPAQPAVAPLPPEPDHGDDVVEINAHVQHAQAQVGRAMRDAERQFKSLHMGMRGPNASRLLVVPAADAESEEVSKVREDLAIMSRVLQRAVSPDGQKRGGFRFDFGDLRVGGRNDLDAMYLDGFGAMFLLEVDFPLSAPSKPEAKKTVAKEPKDAAWEQARRELAGKPGGEDAWELHEEDDEDDEPTFDADQVERLKKRLFESLRSAGNIRGLKSGEQVIVQVTGKAPKHPRPVIVQGRPGGVGGAYRSNVFMSDSGDGFGATTLTIRVKKSQVEDFAEGKVTAEEFAKRVTLTLRDEATPPITSGPK